MLSSCAIYYNIVDEDLHERRNILAKNFDDNALKIFSLNIITTVTNTPHSVTKALFS